MSRFPVFLLSLLGATLLMYAVGFGGMFGTLWLLPHLGLDWHALNPLYVALPACWPALLVFTTLLLRAQARREAP